MDIKLTELQVQLQDTSKKFMEKECTMQFVREMEKSELGYSSDMWQQMADMGWLGLPLPEDCGGMGMSTVDLVILMRELGRKICPTPYFSTVVIGGEPITFENKSNGDWVNRLEDELSGREVVISGTFSYNDDTIYRSVLEDAQTGAQDDYTMILPDGFAVAGKFVPYRRKT